MLKNSINSAIIILIHVNAVISLVTFRKGMSLHGAVVRSLRLWIVFLTFAFCFQNKYATVR